MVESLDFVKALNQQQREAVETTEGPFVGVIRCRHGQNARVDNAHCIFIGNGMCAAVGNFGRYLYQ